jgi:hypothetical protein
MGFIGTLSIEDVLKSVLLTTLKDSPNSALRAAYHRVLDTFDDGDKDLTFALIQDHCACEIRRSAREPDARGRDPLQGVTPTPSAWLVQLLTNRAPSPIVCGLMELWLPICATSSTTMMKSLGGFSRRLV